MINQKTLLIFAGCSGMIAVGLGALGAHALKVKLTSDQLSSFEVGIRYQMYHTIVLIILAYFIKREENAGFKRAAVCMMIGMPLFCGSIYLLSTKSVISLENIGWLGPVTPIGGLFFIAGWGFLLQGALELNKNKV